MGRLGLEPSTLGLKVAAKVSDTCCRVRVCPGRSTFCVPPVMARPDRCEPIRETNRETRRRVERQKVPNEILQKFGSRPDDRAESRQSSEEGSLTSRVSAFDGSTPLVIYLPCEARSDDRSSKGGSAPCCPSVIRHDVDDSRVGGDCGFRWLCYFGDRVLLQWLDARREGGDRRRTGPGLTVRTQPPVSFLMGDRTRLKASVSAP